MQPSLDSGSVQNSVGDLTAPPECTALILAPVTLWTIQDAAVLPVLDEKGRLQAAGDRVHRDDWNSYEWMAAQLGARCGAPPEGASSPLWAWYQFSNEQSPTPDLEEPALLEPGTEGICIAVRLPRESVLLSDFDRWHYVLNRWYLALSEAESGDFEARCAAAGLTEGISFEDLTLELRQSVEDSWQRIFDLDNHFPWIDSGGREARRIQAVTWEIRADQILSIQRFRAR